MAGYRLSTGESATQAIYNNEWAPYRAQYGATTSLSDIDFYCGYGCPAGWQSHFWQDQFSSLYALSSIGMSYYNAGQFTLRIPPATASRCRRQLHLVALHRYGVRRRAQQRIRPDYQHQLRLIQRNPEHLEALPQPRQPPTSIPAT